MFSWCKSERANIEGQEVRLLLGWYDKEGIDVQVNFGATCSVLWRTILPDTTYLPRFIEKDEYNTEEIFKFIVIEGNPKVECWLLFLQGKYVKVGRNGLWHLRGEYKTLFNEKISSILSYGKAGKQAFDKIIFT